MRGQGDINELFCTSKKLIIVSKLQKLTFIFKIIAAIYKQHSRTAKET